MHCCRDSFSACLNEAAAATTISASYVGYGDFRIDIGSSYQTNDFDCGVVVRVWSGSSPAGVVSVVESCDTFSSPVTFSESDLDLGPIGFEKAFEFAFELYDGLGDATCETEVELFPTANTCLGTLTADNTDYGEFTLSLVEAEQIRKCVFYVFMWADGVPENLPWRVTTDCSPAVFRDRDLGLDFSYGDSYRWGYAQFASDANIEVDLPLCAKTNDAAVLTAPACGIAPFNLAVVDDSNVRLTLNISPRAYMVCRVTQMDQDDPGTVVVDYRVGACTDDFYFPGVEDDLFYWKLQLYLRMISGEPYFTCAATNPGKSPLSIEAYSPANLVVSPLPNAVYAFAIPSPEPIDGSCLLISEIDAYTAEIPFPCRAGIRMTIEEMTAAFGALDVGDTLGFNWTYSNGADLTAVTPVTVTVYAPALISAVSIGPPAAQGDPGSPLGFFERRDLPTPTFPVRRRHECFRQYDGFRNMHREFCSDKVGGCGLPELLSSG